MNIEVISIDLAKNVFQVCVINEHNKVVIALANKMARIFWAVLSSGQPCKIV